jgi:FlaA1/EpsC-like NDP-sugar epimerase
MQFKAISKRKILLLGGDIFIILLSTLLGFLIRTGKALNFLDTYTGASLINLFVFPILFYIFDLYDLQLNFKSIKGLTKIIASVLAGVAIISFLFYALPHFHFGRGIFLIEILILAPLIYLWRGFSNRYFRATVRPKRILLMGKDWVLETLYTILKGNPEYQVLGVVNGDTESTGNPFPTKLPVYQIKDVEDLKSKGGLDGIVTELMEEKPVEIWQSLLRLKMSGLNIMGAITLYQDLTGKIPIHFANDKWFVHSAGYTLLTSGFAQRVNTTASFSC